MRILITGDRKWYCPDLAAEVISRLLVRYGPSIVIVHGGATGVDRSFAEVFSGRTPFREPIRSAGTKFRRFR